MYCLMSKYQYRAEEEQYWYCYMYASQFSLVPFSKGSQDEIGLARVEWGGWGLKYIPFFPLCQKYAQDLWKGTGKKFHGRYLHTYLTF